MGIIQQNSGTFGGGGAFTISLPAATSASNRVVVTIAGNTIVATPSGWSLRTSQVNLMGHYAWDQAGGGTSWSFSANGQVNWWVAEVEGGVFVNALSANAASPGATYSTPSLTPTAGTRELVASLGCTTSASTVRTADGWTDSFVERADTCVASSDYPMQGVATRDDVAANGSTAYSTTATFSASSPGRSSIIASYATTAGSTSTTFAAAGTTAATTATTGATTARLAVAGVVAAVSAVTGAATIAAVTYPAAGTVEASSSVTGEATLRASAAGEIPAVSDTTGSVTATLPTTGTVAATSTAAGAATIATTTTGPVGFRDVASNDSGTNTTSSISVTLPATAQVGDRAILWAAWNQSNATLTGPTGWIAEDLQSPSNVISGRVFRKTLEASDLGATLTVSSNGGAGRCAIAVLVDQNAGTAFQAPTFTSSALNVTSHAVPAITPDTTSHVVYIGIISYNAGTNVTPPTGTTERVDRATTHATGRRMGVWAATRNALSSATVNATTFTTNDTAQSLVWSFAIPQGTGGSTPATYPAAGVVAATTGTTGSATSRLATTGTTAATSDTTGTATGRLLTSGTVTATSGTTGAATVLEPGTIPAAGTVAATSTTSGTVTARYATTGTIAAATEATGAVVGYLQAAGTVDVVSDTAGEATAILPAAGTVEAVSDTSGSAINPAGFRDITITVGPTLITTAAGPSYVNITTAGPILLTTHAGPAAT